MQISNRVFNMQANGKVANRKKSFWEEFFRLVICVFMCGNLGGVVVDVTDCDIEVSVFKLHSCNNVPFRINTLTNVFSIKAYFSRNWSLTCYLSSTPLQISYSSTNSGPWVQAIMQRVSYSYFSYSIFPDYFLLISKYSSVYFRVSFCPVIKQN